MYYTIDKSQYHMMVRCIIVLVINLDRIYININRSHV